MADQLGKGHEIVCSRLRLVPEHGLHRVDEGTHLRNSVRLVSADNSQLEVTSLLSLDGFRMLASHLVQSNIQGPKFISKACDDLLKPFLTSLLTPHLELEGGYIFL